MNRIGSVLAFVGVAGLCMWGAAARVAAQEEVPAEPEAEEGAPAEDEAEAEVETEDEGGLEDEGAAAPEAEEAVEEEAPAAEVSAEASAEVGLSVGTEDEAEASGDADAEAAADLVALAEEPEDAGDADEEILVTGSRIKRSVFAASAPVQIIDRKQLEYSGATNLADLVQYLGVANGSGFQGAAAGAGTVSVNLRGLGPGSTLVLFNGRRPVQSGGGVGEYFVDIGTVPMAMVERIEILKGGASAIYGSDAVAGVINIITRQDWDGLRAQVEGQATDDFDQGNVVASLAYGATNDNSRISLGLAYSRQTDLVASSRDFTYGPEGNQNMSLYGNPPSFIAGTLMADPDCNMAEGSMLNEDGNCVFDFGDYQSLIGNGERVNLFANAEYDFTDHTTAFIELNTGRMRGDSVTSPSFFVPPPLPQVPAEHVDNPFRDMNGDPINALLLGRPLGRAHEGNRNTSADDTFRVVLGLKGDFEDVGANTIFEDWGWEAFASWGMSRYRLKVHDNLRPELQYALQQCGDPSDLDECFNPFYSSETGEGTPNPSSVINSFASEQITLTDQRMQTYNLGLNGSFVELPGGDFGFALGGQIRHETRGNQLSHESNEEKFAFLVGNTDNYNERDVYGGYAELLIPIWRGIELQGAGRIESYSDTGQTTGSPTVGLTLTPSQIIGQENMPSALHRLQLRGHFARAFRVGTLGQTGDGFTTLPAGIILDSGSTVFIPVRYPGNPDLEPEEATAVSGGLMWSPVREISLVGDYWYYNYTDRIDNQDPQQLAQDMDAILNGQVQFDPATGQVSGITAFTQNSAKVITQGIDAQLILRIDGSTFGGEKDDFGTISLTPEATYILGYEIPAGDVAGSVRDNPDLANCPNAPEPDQEDIAVAETCDVAGLRNSLSFAPSLPRLRANIPLSWSYNGHFLTFITHVISAYRDDESTVGDADLAPFEKVDAFITFDAQYGYTLDDTVGKELSFRIGVLNMLDRNPPGLRVINGYDTTTHDPRGRMLYAKLIQVF